MNQGKSFQPFGAALFPKHSASSKYDHQSILHYMKLLHMAILLSQVRHKKKSKKLLRRGIEEDNIVT